ncbi:MAG: hypothetical protein ACXVX5_00875 [Mycobacterium sp.]
MGEEQPVQGWQTAQAVSFIRALRDHLDGMISQLTWIERQHVTSRNARACAMRAEAATLRKDIHEAQLLIDALRRRYLRHPARPRQSNHQQQPESGMAIQCPSPSAGSPGRG